MAKPYVISYKIPYVIYWNYICNFNILHITLICNLYVISYVLHINYISVLLRSVGNLPGTCWKLFGKPVISKEKSPTRGAQWWEMLYGFFPFLFGVGEGAWLFGPSPGAGRLRNNETIVRLGRFQSHVYAVLFRDSKQNQIHQPDRPYNVDFWEKRFFGMSRKKVGTSPRECVFSESAR